MRRRPLWLKDDAASKLKKFLRVFPASALISLLQMAVSLGPRRWCPDSVACGVHERCLNEAVLGGDVRRRLNPRMGSCGSLPSIAHVLSRVARLVLQALVAAAGRFLDDHLRRGVHAGFIARVLDIFLCPVHRRMTLASNERKEHLCLRHLAQDTLLWALRNTLFQESDALRMMFRFLWAVLLCFVLGTVSTLLLSLLFQMLNRAGLSRSQSHGRRASGGACVLAPLTGTTARCQASIGTSVFRNTPQGETPATPLPVQARVMDVCCFEGESSYTIIYCFWSQFVVPKTIAVVAVRDVNIKRVRKSRSHSLTSRS